MCATGCGPNRPHPALLVRTCDTSHPTVVSSLVDSRNNYDVNNYTAVALHLMDLRVRVHLFLNNVVSGSAIDTKGNKSTMHAHAQPHRQKG